MLWICYKLFQSYILNLNFLQFILLNRKPLPTIKKDRLSKEIQQVIKNMKKDGRIINITLYFYTVYLTTIKREDYFGVKGIKIF